MKTKRINLRVSDETDAIIRTKAKKANMTITDYVIRCATKKKVANYDGLKELTTQLKKLGNNLNQLVILARQGKVQIVFLGDMVSELSEIHTKLSKISGGK